MSYDAQIREAEQDLARLFRNRSEVEADLQALSRLPIAEQHPALFNLTSKHPGLTSLGFLLSLNDNDRQSLLVTLWPPGPQRDFTLRLLQLVHDNEGLSRAFGGVMPSMRIVERVAEKFERARSHAKAEPAPSQTTPPASELIPLPPDLQKLIAAHINSPALPPITLGKPVSGHLGGAEIVKGDDLTLKIHPSGSIRVYGTDPDDFDRFGGGSEPGFISPIKDDIDIDLDDGSGLYGEIFMAEKKHHSNDKGFWRGVIDEWNWQSSEEIKSWGAQLEISEDFQVSNLNIKVNNGGSSLMTKGYHIPGSPSVTIVNKHGKIEHHRDEDENEVKNIHIFIESVNDRPEYLPKLWSIIDIVCVVFGLEFPTVLRGFNRVGVLCAAAGRHRSILPPSVSNYSDVYKLVPSNRRDIRGKSRYWNAAFVRRLINECLQPRSIVRESIFCFKTIFGAIFVEDQISNLGMSIRVLLNREGTLRKEDYMSVEKVNLALRTFARIKAIDLPEQTEVCLDASHRIALLGARGIAGSNIDMRSTWLSERPIEILNTLRLVYGCLLAAVIEYTGPLNAGSDPKTGAPLLHYPLRKPRAEAVAEDEELASQQFVVDLRGS